MASCLHVTTLIVISCRMKKVMRRDFFQLVDAATADFGNDKLIGKSCFLLKHPGASYLFKISWGHCSTSRRICCCLSTKEMSPSSSISSSKPWIWKHRVGTRSTVVSCCLKKTVKSGSHFVSYFSHGDQQHNNEVHLFVYQDLFFTQQCHIQLTDTFQRQGEKCGWIMLLYPPFYTAAIVGYL